MWYEFHNRNKGFRMFTVCILNLFIFVNKLKLRYLSDQSIHIYLGDLIGWVQCCFSGAAVAVDTTSTVVEKLSRVLTLKGALFSSPSGLYCSLLRLLVVWISSPRELTDDASGGGRNLPGLIETVLWPLSLATDGWTESV